MSIYYTIYQTTNKVNGKIYIGKHKTSDLNDGYLGSGKLLNLDIEKYGIENFYKEILFIFENEIDMNLKEAELVTNEFIKEDSNYNLCPGGQGGWSFVNSNGHNIKKNNDISRRMKISKSHKGKKRSLQHRKSISKALQGRDCYWLTGKKRPEHSKKLSGFRSPTAIHVKYKGKIYGTIKEMSEDTNISYYLIKKMINNGEVKQIENLGDNYVLQYQPV